MGTLAQCIGENWTEFQRYGLSIAACRFKCRERQEEVVSRATARALNDTRECPNQTCERSCRICRCPERRCCKARFGYLVQREATTLLKQERRYQTGLESYIRSKTVPSLPRRLDTFNTAAVFTIIHAINFGHRSDEGVLSRVVPESIPTEKWQELVEQAHRVAYRILGNHIDAAEAVGNATVKVVSSETEPDNVGGYFVQTVKNEALRIRSKQQGRLVHSEDGWDLSSEDDGDVSDTCIAIEEEAMLAEAVSDLAPIDRTILRMRYWELKSFGEIGKALDMPEPTVRKRHQRALGTLRSRLVTTCEADRMLMVQA